MIGELTDVLCVGVEDRFRARVARDLDEFGAKTVAIKSGGLEGDG